MATLTAPTLQNLITNVRILLNQTDPNNSLWTNNELTNYLNEAIRLYFLECVLVNEGYFTTQTDLNIVTDTQTIALPTDCFEVKVVYKKVTNGYIVLPYQNNLMDSYSTQGGSSSDSFFPGYYFQGNNLVIRPTPNFSETAGIRLEYIQFPDNMVWGGDSMTNQVSPIFKQLIEMYAVYKAKLKESMVNGGMMHKVPQENVAQLYQSFKETISRRSRYPTFIIPFSPETE